MQVLRLEFGKFRIWEILNFHPWSKPSPTQSGQSSMLSQSMEVPYLCTSGPEVIKQFPCSNQLSINFQLLIKTKMLKNTVFSCF